jgi:hypothetical protein
MPAPEQKTKAPGIDVEGLANLHRERAKRYAPIYAAGGDDLSICIRLLHRMPKLAGAALKALHAEMDKMPGGGVDLDQPLFGSDGKWLHGGAC